jgi:hypothetical protein
MQSHDTILGQKNSALCNIALSHDSAICNIALSHDSAICNIAPSHDFTLCNIVPSNDSALCCIARSHVFSVAGMIFTSVAEPHHFNAAPVSVRFILLQI